MKNRDKNICDEFETEVFLFRENSLPEDRLIILKSHLKNCQTCQSVFNEVDEITRTYDDLEKVDIDEHTFSSMIRKATGAGNRISAQNDKRKSLVEIFGFYRLSFSGAAVVAAIILIIISFIKEPSLEKRLPADLLDWDGDKIGNKIEQIENQIISLKSDEWDIYIVRKNEKENWNTTLKSIRNQIDKMKESTNKKEL